MSQKPWLIISKPLRPPFRDGSTVLLRDLVQHMPESRSLAYLGDPAAPLRPAGDRVIGAPPAGYAPTMTDKLRALAAMLRHPGMPVHLSFTPGKATAAVVSLLRRLQPRRLFVQSLMSSHGAEAWTPLLRPLDAVVALSHGTARRLRDAGVPESKIATIRPAVATTAADHPSEVAGRKRLLYAGDLDGEIAARLVALARATAPSGWSLTIACRPKAEGDAEARAGLQRDLAGDLASGRVELLAEVADMDALYRRSALQLFAATHTRKKVDLPLALLEGLARGVPAAIVDVSPAAELLHVGHDAGLRAGLAAPAEPDAFARAIAEVVHGDTVASWSEHAAALAAREFSLTQMAGRYDALYSDLESKRRK
ncbi:glycosyltransferase [Nannocystis pusilla]|uniref:Glycosyltransferase n=1 Tax=Nannocystis pusilla TaxID=889268 RepID=A0A9X3EXM1_9BACT|nr:glycosyltransferase [Nannocystis pusilla]MCY1012227.1 glycosyltransferase [Nannocystis pusilla]